MNTVIFGTFCVGPHREFIVIHLSYISTLKLWPALLDVCCSFGCQTIKLSTSFEAGVFYIFSPGVTTSDFYQSDAPGLSCCWCTVRPELLQHTGGSDCHQTHTHTPCEFVWRGLIPLNLRPEVGGLGGTAVLTDIQIPLFPLSLSHSSFSQAGTQTEGSLTQPLIPLKTTTATYTHTNVRGVFSKVLFRSNLVLS